jgi:predicted dehydrogenase
LGLIGCGAHGTDLLAQCESLAPNVRVVAVSDAYRPRLEAVANRSGAAMESDWRALVDRADVDCVLIATPDHWHAPMVIRAMLSGKDVYCEGPIGRTLSEAVSVRRVAKETGAVFQCGTADAASPHWLAARETIASGALGDVVWSQGNYSRDEGAARWNAPIDADFRTDALDWQAFQGDEEASDPDAERFFRWRKYAAYSDGIATDLLHAKLAGLQVALGADLPKKVSAAGGIYDRDGRDVPDSFVLTAEYNAGHTIVLASSMAQQQERPAVIRGREATLYCQGDRLELMSEGKGVAKRVIEPAAASTTHLENWIDAVRTRTQPMCDAEFGYKTMATIDMALRAYRTGSSVTA